MKTTAEKNRSRKWKKIIPFIKKKGWKLNSANLSYADLSYIDMSNIEMIGANFFRANVYMSKMNKANVSGAQFIETDLRFTDMRGINAHGAIFTDARMQSAVLKSADISEAQFFRTDCYRMDATGADAASAFFMEAKLHSAILRGASLRHANFNSANVREADFRGSDLRSVDWTSASLAYANFSQTFGMLNPSEWLRENFEVHPQTKLFVVYKAKRNSYPSPASWRWTPGAVLEETCNYDPTSSQGSGIYFSTLENVRALYSDRHEIWKALLTGIPCVPYDHMGSARTNELKLIKRVE